MTCDYCKERAVTSMSVVRRYPKTRISEAYQRVVILHACRWHRHTLAGDLAKHEWNGDTINT